MRTLSIGCTLLFLFTIAFGAGCESSGGVKPSPTAEAPLENTYWKLVEVDGRPARVAETSFEPYFQLDSAQRKVHGGTGCNIFTGPYELAADTLHFGPLASTRRACLDPEMGRQESALLDALAATRTWQITGDTLVLSGPAGPVARFEAQFRR